MKLIVRAAGISFLFLVFLIIIFYLLVNGVIIPRALVLEDNYARSNGETVRNIIFDDSRTLQRTAYSYGTWDNTWLYLKENSSDYIQKNLGPVTLIPEGLHGALFFLPDKRFFSGVSYDDTTGASRQISESVLSEIQRDDLLFSSTLARRGVSGIVSTIDGAFIIGTSPVLPSNASGDPAGIIVLFKDLDPGLIEKYESIGGYPITIRQVGIPDSSLEKGRIIRLNETIIRYEAYLSSPTASLPIVLVIDQQRVIFQQQTEWFSTLMIILIATGLLLALFLFITISGSIIRPLTRLDRTIKDITQSGDLSHEATPMGATELMSLASSFNIMVRTIQEKEEHISQMAEQRYRILLERASDAILIVNPDTYEIIDANIKAETLFDFECRQISLSFLTSFHPADELATLKLFNAKTQVLMEGVLEEGTIITKNGVVIPVELSASLVNIGENRYLLVFYRDICDRKRMHAALIESEDMFRKIASGTVVGVFLIFDNRFVYVNDYLATLCGYTRDEMMIQPDPVSIIAGDSTWMHEVLRHHASDRNAERKEVALDSRVTVRDGTVRVFRIYATTIEYKCQPALIGTCIDITHETNLEELRQTAYDKIEHIMEQLAIYNDHIRNPLTVIFGIAELEGGLRMQEIKNQVDIIDKIIDQVDKGFIESTKVREFMKKHHFVDET